MFEVSEAKIGMFVKKFTQNPLKKKKNKTYTVLTTNKERTNKEQITFFKKIYWLLIRNKYFEFRSTNKNNLQNNGLAKIILKFEKARLA